MSPTETASSTKREISVEIPAQDVTRETDVLVEKYRKLARIPGFRKGHVPASIIRRQFAEDLKTDVAETLVPRYFRREAEKQGLVPISQPRVTDLHIHDGEPLRFKASFEVMPEINIEGYKELRADKPEIKVTDEEVQQALDGIRDQHATYTPVEGRTLADGDYAQASFEGKPKEGDGGDDAVQPVRMDEVLIEIGGKNTVAEFSAHLRGAAAGEERTFDVAYPADAPDKRLAGKTMVYTVKVQAIKQKQLPELNDDFAKELGQFENIEQVRKQIRENMEAERKHMAEREAKDKLVAELVQRNDFEVPESLVEKQIDIRLERGLRALAAQGMKVEDMKKMDFPRLRSGQREQAVADVKASLLLERVAELEKITVSDAEVEGEVQALAKQAGQTEQAVRARMEEEGGLERLRHRMRSEKTLEFLYQQTA